MPRLTMRLLAIMALTSLVMGQCMAQKTQSARGVASIAWRRVLQNVGPLAEDQQPQILTHTRSTKQLVSFLRDLFSSPAEPPLQPESTSTAGSTTTAGSTATAGSTTTANPDPASTSSSKLSEGMTTLLGGLKAIASLADDDVVDNKPDSICDCKSVQDDVIQAFFGSCEGVADIPCCDALKTAGANKITGCQCASTVACATVPFRGPGIMGACGYNMGICK